MCAHIIYTILSEHAFPDTLHGWLLYTQIINILVFNIKERPNTESWDCCIILNSNVEDTRNAQQKWKELISCENQSRT